MAKNSDPLIGEEGSVETPQPRGEAFYRTGDEELDRIRAEIENTQGEMEETLDAIREKASLQNIRQQVGDKVKEAASRGKDAALEKAQNATRRIGGTIVDAAREDPLRVAMFGLGAGLLFSKRSKSAARKRLSTAYPDLDWNDVRAYKRRAGSEAQRAARSLRRRAVQAPAPAREMRSVLRLAGWTKEAGAHSLRRALQAGATVSRAFDERPWTAGMAMGAAGILIGASVPLFLRSR
ncbi:MAG: DUF3618 domain-containing protein [bacterium]